MFSTTSSLLILVVTLCSSAVNAVPLVLTQNTFADVTSSGRNGIVKFYQSWCGHCKSMAPDYEELSDAVDASVFIADVNCGDEEELCSEHGVQGYPTIKAYKDGDISDYNGGRTYEDMFEFVQTELANPCDANVLDPETCSAKAIAYVGKWKAKDDTASMSKEITRLQGMKNQHMKSELKVWISQRIGLLKQLSPSGDSSVDDEEL